MSCLARSNAHKDNEYASSLIKTGTNDHSQCTEQFLQNPNVGHWDLHINLALQASSLIFPNLINPSTFAWWLSSLIFPNFIYPIAKPALYTEIWWKKIKPMIRKTNWINHSNWWKSSQIYGAIKLVWDPQPDVTSDIIRWCMPRKTNYTGMMTS